jgi:hypothetical protein
MSTRDDEDDVVFTRVRTCEERNAEGRANAVDVDNLQEFKKASDDFQEHRSARKRKHVSVDQDDGSDQVQVKTEAVVASGYKGPHKAPDGPLMSAALMDLYRAQNPSSSIETFRGNPQHMYRPASKSGAMMCSACGHYSRHLADTGRCKCRQARPGYGDW